MEMEMEMEGRGQGKEGGEGYGGHGCLSVASWTHLRGGRRGQGFTGCRRSWGQLYGLQRKIIKQK